MLLSTLVFASAVAANPIVPHPKLRLSRELNLTGVHNILQRDQARAHQLKAKGNSPQSNSIIDESVINQALIYTANVGVGSPATFYSLIIDTGSSNTWVGASKPYVKTKTSQQTADSVSVTYGSGAFSGTEYIDTVTLDRLVVTTQSIGASSSSIGFSGVDGILGIGPVDLTIGTLFPDENTTIPTVTDNAFTEKKISAHKIGISFEPTSSKSIQNGELSWGGIDSTKYSGPIHFTPVTSTSPASLFWGIQESITYGATTILHSTAGIVDTGTTLILIATDAFNRYQSATGGVADLNTGLLTITSSKYSVLRTLNFHINGVTYGLTPNGQIWPRSLNTIIGGTAGSIYLVVNDIGAPSGQGLDFIDGYTFLERFYSVFDTANKCVGFATTPFTKALTN